LSNESHVKVLVALDGLSLEEHSEAARVLRRFSGTVVGEADARSTRPIDAIGLGTLATGVIANVLAVLGLWLQRRTSHHDTPSSQEVELLIVEVEITRGLRITNALKIEIAAKLGSGTMPLSVDISEGEVRYRISVSERKQTIWVHGDQLTRISD
jgi:hypothetical protein